MPIALHDDWSISFGELPTKRTSSSLARWIDNRLGELVGESKNLVHYAHIEVGNAAFKKHIILAGENHGKDDKLWEEIREVVEEASKGVQEGRVDFFVEMEHMPFGKLGIQDISMPATEAILRDVSTEVAQQAIQARASGEAYFPLPDFDESRCYLPMHAQALSDFRRMQMRVSIRSQVDALLSSEPASIGDLDVSEDFAAGLLSAGRCSAQRDVEAQRRALGTYPPQERVLQRLASLAIQRWRSSEDLHFHAFDVRNVLISRFQDCQFVSAPKGAIGFAEYLIARQLGKGIIMAEAAPVLREVLRAAAADDRTPTGYMYDRAALSDLYCLARMFKASNVSSPVAIVYCGASHSQNMLLMLRAMFSRSERFQMREVLLRCNDSRLRKKSGAWTTGMHASVLGGRRPWSIFASR